MSWESSYDDWKTTPPDDPDPLMYDEFDKPIYDGDIYYEVDGIVLSKESYENSKFENSEDENFVCELCGEEFKGEDTEEYVLIDGKKFCIDCIESSDMVAMS